MMLAWIFLIAITSVANSQPCRRLFMQGLDNTQLLPYAELSGLYSLTNITFNGFPAYQHETHPNQYFFYNSTQRVLVLGHGVLLAQTSGRLPMSNVQYPYSRVITGWRVLQPATSSYESVPADYIRPRCMDDDPGFQQCDSGQLTFNEELTLQFDNSPSVNVTQYEQVYGQYAAYRPVYKATHGSSSVKVYLYHANGTWRLGHGYTASTPEFARVNDTALRPEFITGVWQLHYNGIWRSNNNLKLRCTGNGTATSCSDIQCQNGGICITAGSQNVQCSCPRGYRGPRCEARVPSCQHFGNWTGYYGGFYYTEDSYEGSLTAWFCPKESQPEFGYSVCENRYYSASWSNPSWSNRATCQSPTTKPQWSEWTWTRTTTYPRYTYHRRNDGNDFRDALESADPWLTPVVAIVVVLIQVFAPFIIYWVLIECCGYRKKTTNPFAKADEKENEAIVEKYQKQLEELESRTLKPENTVTITELRRIQQQLEEEVDQLRARRRQRNREKQKTAKLFRIVSFYYYISFWLWMIYLMITYGAKLGQYASLFGVLAVIAIICMIALPIVFVIESYFSAERQYIKNLSSLTSATDRIESIRNAQPTVCMNAECYHFELRTRTVYYTDANGNMQSRLETYQEKVVTAFIVEQFLFTHWFDSSQSTLTDIRKAGITKIKMELTVQFGDQTTAEHFEEKYQQFRDENRYRDVYVNFFISNTVDGFEKRLAAYTDSGSRQGWVRPLWFWLATFSCLGWPYRIMFNRTTGKTEYNVVKVIFTKTPTTQDTSCDDDHNSESPSENASKETQGTLSDAGHNSESPPKNASEETQDTSSDNDDSSESSSENSPEENTIKNIKTNIECRLVQLSGSLENDDEMPVKCAATDQHINVTLMEAHHTPQTAT